MLDNICGATSDVKQGVDDHESQHLLSPSSSSSAAYDSSFAIFNDLTYSDDDEADEYWAAEMGVSGSISSPETAALLNEIQNAMFPAQEMTAASTAASEVQHQQQSHLMHPLARHESVQSSDCDDRSYLEYSIASEETKQCMASNHVNVHSPNYGSVDHAHNSTIPGAFDLKPKSPGVAFRPPSSVFDHSNDKQARPKQRPSISPTRQPSSQSRRTSSLKPKPQRVENLHPNNQTRNNNYRDKQQQSSYTSDRYQQQHINYYTLNTPLPSISSESPVTSATATDTTQSPTANQYDNDPNDQGVHTREAGDEGENPKEKQRITKILSAEATKRLKRHKRLKRIKKAAEAREAAVKKVRGKEQDPNRCNDAVFAFMFLCQFLLVSMSALAFGPGALRDRIYGSIVLTGGGGNQVYDTNDYAGKQAGDVVGVDYNPFEGLQTDDIIIMDKPQSSINYHHEKETLEEEISDGISHIDYVNVIQLVCIAGGYASLCSLLALGFMMMLSKSLLHATLVFTIGACLTWTILGLAFSSCWVIPVSGMCALAISFFYTVVVWDRISFAATNLSVALKGMRSTLDIPFVGLGVLLLTFLWTIWWICAFIGTFDFLNDDAELSNNWMSVVIVFFLFSYYWTFQVIKGISQTTVASIIGKWWDMSEDDPLPVCSNVLHNMLSRNIIGSFGSICLGSLIVGPCICLTRISTLSHLAKPKLKQLRTPKLSEPEDAKCHGNECMPTKASCTPQYYDTIISRNVNQWSWAYIGLYRYKFWDAGSKASQLFKARGWTHVVSDDLILTAMMMSSMIIGGSTACLGLIVEEVDGYSFTSLNKPIATAFLISLFVGVSLSSAFLSIIEGSVSAILVCYASAPVEFHANHHKLSEEMKSAWKHFWLQKPAR